MPEDLPTRNHRIAKIAAERVIDRIEKMRDHLGVRPWEAPTLTAEESLEAFRAIVDDPEAWTQLIDAERQLFHLTPDRAPRRLIAEARQMYKRMQTMGRTEEAPTEDVY